MHFKKITCGMLLTGEDVKDIKNRKYNIKTANIYIDNLGIYIVRLVKHKKIRLLLNMKEIYNLKYNKNQLKITPQYIIRDSCSYFFKLIIKIDIYNKYNKKKKYKLNVRDSYIKGLNEIIDYDVTNDRNS